MGVSSTYDERYGSSTLQAPPGSYDAPDIFGTLYQVAQGMSQSAYGATMPTYGMDVDVDAYSLGTLSPARYTIYVNPTNWGTKPPIVWVNQTPTIEMYRGSTLLTTSSSGSLTFEVFASAGYNVKLSGRTATQYQLYYTASPLTPTVQFSTTSGSANEGNSDSNTVSVEAALSAVSTQAVTVPITYSGTASSGLDYTNYTFNITIPAGQTTGSASFSVIGDTVVEPNETVILTLGTPTNATLGTNKLYTHSIVNDDNPIVDDFGSTSSTAGRISIGSSVSGIIEVAEDTDWFAISLTGGQAYTFRLNTGALIGLSDPYLRLYNATGNLLAENDDDSSSLNSLVAYTPSASGTYYLRASDYGSGTGSYLLSASASSPTVQFSTTSGSANEGNSGSSTVTVEATLSAVSTQTVSVPISYSGTASAGTDYTNTTASITIPAGQTAGSATFTVISDTTVEPNETVILTLGTPTNATLGTNTTFTQTLVNDDNATPPPLYPFRGWTRQFGTSSGTFASALTTGDDGTIYLAGSTRGDLDGQTNSTSDGDAFLTKYNPDGTKVWTKLLGSIVINYATSLTIGSDGAIYMAGNFEFGAETQPAALAFLTKYLPDGTREWATFLESSSTNRISALTSGTAGVIYGAGTTYGDLDGQMSSGESDAFLIKFNPNGTKAWTRLLGSNSYDNARALTTGTDGAIYMAGGTSSDLDGQPSRGGGDAFLTKYDANGNKAWTRLVGTNSSDWANSLSLGRDGAIYLAGSTRGSFDGQTNSGGMDAFLTKFDASGSETWTRMLGSDDYDYVDALTTGVDGAIYMAGYTYGSLGGQTNSGHYDAFITKFNSDGTKAWTRLLGSSTTDFAHALTTGTDGSIYMAGETYGSVDGQPQTGNEGVFKAYLTNWIVAESPRLFGPTVQFSTTSGSANEGNSGSSTVTVQATLSAAATQTVTVPISYSGTAISGTDYTNATTSITIAAGQTTGSASFSVIGDTTLESNETVILTMGTPTNATLGANTSYTHTITNDDVPSVQFAATSGSSTEGNSGTSTITVQATLSAASTQTVTVPVTYSGTATSGTDYSSATTSITIAAGQTTGSASFSIIGDTTLESNETVILTLGTPTNATLGANTSYTHTITNDDLPSVQFAATSGSATEGNSGTSTITVQATLSAVSSQTVTIPISYSGTATSGTDYTNATSSITVAAGQTTGAATFSILFDTNVEPNETIILTMGTPTNATLGTNKVYTHTVLNDDLDQQVVSRTNALTVLVDKGVLESKPVLLKDLVEVITTTGSTVTSHTVTYQGTKFKYSDIDALITTVIRDSEFTEEFHKEIADQYPTIGNITYKEAVSLVGAANIDVILISVAGADGNYVG